MTTLTAKFQIGQKVFHCGISDTQRRVQCPDCLDTKQWEALTPAGESLKFTCPRCTGWQHGSKPLIREIVPSIRPLTIGSIRVDTADGEGTSYMCEETGVGCGSIYRESFLFEDEETATRAAEAQCLARMAEPERASQYRADTLATASTFTVKAIEEEASRRRKYQFALEDVQRAVFDDSITESDLREQLRRDLAEISQ